MYGVLRYVYGLLKYASLANDERNVWSIQSIWPRNSIRDFISACVIYALQLEGLGTRLYRVPTSYETTYICLLLRELLPLRNRT